MTQYDENELPEGITIGSSDKALYVYKNYSDDKIIQRAKIKAKITKPVWSMTEDIVISGMSGRFPESDTVEEFEYNLYNNIDMVVEDEKRWPYGYLGLPRGSGKIKDISLFDHKFFHVDEKDAEFMDSQVRIMLEITFEALWDAGIDPASLAGSKTGVFLGNCFDEYLSAYAQDYTKLPTYKQSFFAMLSNIYDFRGPSKPFDTACASGFSALHEAMVSLRYGQCDRAIVVGLNLCLRAATQNQFLNLNMISPDGHCKCLDDDANGYAKGEACVAIVLQRKSEAKRIYATIVHTKTNCDGNKDLGITYPSFELQRELIEDTYKEIEMDPLDIDYCEGHCTGTQAGDPSEMRAIYESMCKGRTNPLLIGAIKSVIGHTEASSGLCSLVKTLLAFEHELIPANLHMNKINHRIEGLVNGILKPVITNTPYKGKYIALNCFGFGGVNVHAIIQKHDKEIDTSASDTLPRLIVFSGRNQETLDTIYDFLTKNPSKLTPGFLALLNDVSKTSPYPSKMFKGMRHRGYVLFDKNQDTNLLSELKTGKIKDKIKPPVCFVFTGMGCQWTAMGKDLTQFPTINSTFEKCSQVLKSIDPSFELIQILTSEDSGVLKTTLNSFVAIAAIQIALVDLLEYLGIIPDHIVGHSIGELVCAYADKCLTLEETISCAYWRGKCIEEQQNSTRGSMAAIGCTWQKATELCNELADGNVWPACHNGSDSVTISGDKVSIELFIEKIQQTHSDMFVRQVNSSGVAFHSPRIENIRKNLLDRLSSVIKDSTRSKSTKWISTTYEEEPVEFKSQYMVDNLILPVRFYEAFQKLPSDGIYLEIAPHHLLQSVIKRNLMDKSERNIKYVPTLAKQVKGFGTNVTTILQSFGAMYAMGLNPKIELLYPKVEYPVKRGTASLNSFIRWRHDRKFTVTQYPKFFNITKLYESIKTIDLQFEEEKYITDHCIDGRILFPATGYLFLAWTNVAKLLNVSYENLPIIFEDVNLHRATIMPKSGVTSFDIRFLQGTGTFVISESGTITTTGKIKIDLNNINVLTQQHLLSNIEKLEAQPCLMQMSNKDVYKEFRLRGYDYGSEFQSIEHIKQVDSNICAKIVFKNWVTFVDSMIQLAVLGRPMRGLYLPVRLNSLCCDPKVLNQALSLNEESKILNVIFDGILNIGVAPGIEFQGIKANLAPRKLINQNPVEETFEFVAHDEHDIPYSTSRANSEAYSRKLTEHLKKYIDVCSKLALEQTSTEEFDKSSYEKYIGTPILHKVLEEINSSENPDVQAMLENIEEDLLFQTYTTELFVRSQLETICENILDSTFNILEVNQNRTTMAKALLNYLKLSSFKVNFQYNLLHYAPEKLPQAHLDLVHSQHSWLVEKSKFPPDIVNIDAVFYKDSSLCPLVSKFKVNFELMLESMWNSLKDNRFALILLKDKMYPFEEFLMKKQNVEVNNSSRLEELMNALKKTEFKIIGHKSNQLGVHAVFVRKINETVLVEDQYFLPISNNPKDWFDPLQTKLRELASSENSKTNVWLIANQNASGVIGLVSCLHKEPLGNRVRCILNCNSKQSIEPNSEIVRNIVKLDLFSNVISHNGSIGSFKHFTLPIEENEPIPFEHCYLNATTRGDLSSLRWFESHHKHWPKNRRPNQTLCTVYYAPLNFRDIMLATGKLPPDALPDDMGLDDCILGLEFSGRDENGNRVMGMVPSKGLATTVVMENSKFLWPIPTTWTMEEASSIPVAYATAYYALIIRGKLQPKEKVLIHSGSGAVGQAAISICLSYDCQIFITVGSEAKRDTLMQIFPKLKPSQFASSRNIDFEKFILQETNGRGVDIVLNSLAEEKLQSSVNCLADYGRFLEIGKFDLSQDNKLNIAKIMGNKTFHGILLDNLLNFGPNVPKIIEKHRNRIWELMNEGIEKGVVRPLDRTIFTVDKCEEAFRYMASGKHIGKVVICIREEEKVDSRGIVNIEQVKRIPAIPRTVFLSNKSYIITGGLGGFGLELINWMIEREARKFVVTSRTGVKDLYQKTRLGYFSRCGATVEIFTEDTSIETGAEKLILQAEKLGPVGGVFHLAMVLSDGLFENQTVQSFETVLRPKSDAFTHLDKITRQKCPETDYFVAFSSVSCGFGNPGQSNYGFANSLMERICEQRREDGLHGFAIQWGAIGDVGYIIDNVRGNDIVVCGSVPQRMPSCLSSLDRLLQMPYSVCSNLIKIDCKTEVTCGKTSLIKTIAHILGVKDYENLEQNISLGELGMDSLMSVEVKQAIERDYDVVLSMQDIRKLTIGKILEIGAGKTKKTTDDGKQTNKNEESLDQKLIPSTAITYLNDIVNGDPIIFLPQIDATYEQIIPLAKKLNRPAIGINWTKDYKDLKTIPDTAAHIINVIEKNLTNLTSNYDLVGYSFGGIIAVDIGMQLQKRKTGKLGLYRKLILLDSSPKQFKIYTDQAIKKYAIKNKNDDQAFVESILMFLLDKLPIDYAKIKELIISMNSNAKRMEFVRDLFKKLQNVEIQSETLEFLITNHYNKMIMMNQYDCSAKQYQGDIMLIRASEYLVKSEDIIREDYWVGEIITGKCHLHVLKGDHKTFITNNYDQMAQLISGYLGN